RSAMSSDAGRRLNPLVELTRTRMLGFLREPEAVFWTFVFPILMALALGIAFRNQGQEKAKVGVEQGPGAEAIAQALGKSPALEVVRLAPAETEAALRRGRVALGAPRGRLLASGLRPHAPRDAARLDAGGRRAPARGGSR